MDSIAAKVALALCQCFLGRRRGERRNERRRENIVSCRKANQRWSGEEKSNSIRSKKEKDMMIASLEIDERRREEIVYEVKGKEY